MAVVAADIKINLSGGAANNNPNTSLGGARSSVDLSGTAMNNLFDNVSPGEATAGRVEYRCVYVANTHATDVLTLVKVFMGSLTPSTSTKLEIGADPAGIGGEAPAVADETTAPTGVTFSEPTTEGAGIAVGTLNAGQAIAIWLRRTVSPGAAANANDATSLEVRGTPT